MPENRENIESSEVQEIIGNPPKGIIKKGNLFIFIFFVVLGILASIVKYPEIIPTAIEITSLNPPISLVAQTDGKIKLLVEDNQLVEENEILAIIDNTTDYEEARQLKDILSQYNPNDFIVNKKENLPEIPYFANLGSIQKSFAVFLISFNNYKDFIEQKYYENKLKALEPQFSKYKDIIELEKKNTALQEDYQLALQDYERQKELFEQGANSKQEVEKAKSRMLQKKAQLQNKELGSLKEEMQYAELRNMKLEIEHEMMEKRIKLESELIISYDNLFSDLNQWEKNYLLISPIKGKVILMTYWKDNQHVYKNSKVMTIDPVETTGTFGRVYLQSRASGKVEIGQRVNIKLENYPFEEYGMLEGVVESEPKIASDGTYFLELSLPNGLITSYGRTLEYKHGMMGVADIITEDLTLLERILYQFRKFND
jgi:multidrug efflux pump subunit AcrA (membrane-fusion protein)